MFYNMRLLVYIFIVTLVKSESQLFKQEENDDHLNPLNHEDTRDAIVRHQQKRTLFRPTVYSLGTTKHVGVHPLGFRYVLGYGPVGYPHFVKPLPVFKPVMHTQGWKPILPTLVKPFLHHHHPVYHHPVEHHPVHHHHPVEHHPVEHPHVHVPIQPVVPVEKPPEAIVPVAPAPSIVKPVIQFQPQLPIQIPFYYPYFKHLFNFPYTLQPNVITPLIPQHPQVLHPVGPHFHPVPVPGLPNPVGPIEPTNAVHHEFSATYPKHPLLGVHTQVPLFRHITPLYPIHPVHPGQIPVEEYPKPILPPVTIHNPGTTHDTENHVPDFQPISPGSIDNNNHFGVHHQHPGAQTPLYLPPHPVFRSAGGGVTSATFPGTQQVVQSPSISLEPPYAPEQLG